VSQVRRFTATDLWKIPRVGTPMPSPDGSFVIVGVTTYEGERDEARERLHLVPLTGDRVPRPLTSPDVSSSQPTLSPDGRRLAFLRKPKDGAPPQLHVMPLDGGEARRLTDLPLGASDPRWLPDGSAIVVSASLYRGSLEPEATRRVHEERTKAGDRPHVTEDRVYRFWDRWLTDGEVQHLFLVDAETGTARDLTPASERWFDLMDPDGDYDIAPDGKEVAFAANATSPPYMLLRSGIFTVRLAAAGDATCITPENPGEDRRPRYSPDGRWLVYGKKCDPTNYADRVRIVRVNRATGEHVTLTEGWDLSPSAWDFAGADTLILEVEERGRTSVYRLSVSVGASSGTPELVARGGTLHGLRAASDGFVYAQHNGLSHPPELARFPVSGGAIEGLTKFTAAALEGVEFGGFEEMEIAGAGGDPLHLFVVFPPGHDPKSACPLVQMVHGGPYGMLGDVWHWRWNAHAFAAPGYAVALVNFHGSSGYGERFANSVLGDWGGKPAEDVLLATDALVARGIADPKRLVVAGGSFGGYMASWLPTRTDRFACTIVHAPAYDTLTLSGGDLTQGLEREIGGEPWELPRTREGIDRSNPAMHTASYRTPTLVTHGEKDYRCPVHHALELYGMLKAKGITARLVHYPDENHWILKRKNSIHWYGEVLGWIARHIA
jgi:dipeptidyl aminopeptidase/acylaminoacyl peptidase